MSSRCCIIPVLPCQDVHEFGLTLENELTFCSRTHHPVLPEVEPRIAESRVTGTSALDILLVGCQEDGLVLMRNSFFIARHMADQVVLNRE